jgi:hypothetical protein
LGGACGTSLGYLADRCVVVLRACRMAGAAFVIVVTVKNILHVSAFVVYLARPPSVTLDAALAGGGLNIEATWLALSAFS